ncbi:unnamed protein product [Prunus armeniaca]
MESFSSIVSLTYARRRQASSPLQTGCFTKHKLNGVFFEHFVPDIRSQATSLISITDKLLREAQTRWNLFISSIVSLTYARRRQALPPLWASYFTSTNSMESLSSAMSPDVHLQDIMRIEV